MKALTLIAAVIRLYALYMLIRFIPDLIENIAFLQLPKGNIFLQELESHPFFSWGYLASTLLGNLVIPLFLLVKANAIAHFVCPGNEEDTHLPGKLSSEVETCLYRCVGLGFFAYYLPDFIVSLAVVMISATHLDGVQHSLFVRFFLSAFQNGHIILPTFGTLLGVLLIFKSDLFYRLVRKTAPAPQDTKTTGE